MDQEVFESLVRQAIKKPTKIFLTKNQAIEKYPFFTQNMMKNILHKNIDGFRKKCVRKLGRRILIDEDEFIKFIDDLKQKNN